MGAPAVSVRGSAAAARTAAPKRRTAARPATARSAPARRVSTPSKRTAASRGAATAPARKRTRTTAPRRRARNTPAGGVAMLPVHAVAGTAGAVGGIADSPLLVSMTRGRAWIAVLGVLLGGIVAINVWGLSLSASTSGTAAKIDELEQSNSVLAARAARRGSTEKISALAASQGLDTANPKAIRYLEYGSSDAADAAKRLAAGEVSILTALPIAPEFADPAATAPLETTTVPTDTAAAPIATEPIVEEPIIDPAAVAPAPETTDPAAVAPADPTTTDPVSGDLGGVAP